MSESRRDSAGQLLGASQPGNREHAALLLVVLAGRLTYLFGGLLSGLLPALPVPPAEGEGADLGMIMHLVAAVFISNIVLALVVAAVAHQVLTRFDFYPGYAAIVLLAAVILAISAICFVSAGEPVAPPPPETATGFAAFLRGGVAVLRGDRDFRVFLYVQWLAGVVSPTGPPSGGCGGAAAPPLAFSVSFRRRRASA